MATYNAQFPPFYPSDMTSVSSMSGVNLDDVLEKNENRVIEKYEKALEIEKKAEKIIKYAEKNNLDVQETLESFFSEEELELYENIFSLKIEVTEIQVKRKLKKLQEKSKMKDYIKKRKPVIDDNITITPWVDTKDKITEDNFDEWKYIKYISNDTNKLHLTV